MTIAVSNDTRTGDWLLSSSALEEFVRTVAAEGNSFRQDITAAERDVWIRKATRSIRANISAGRFELAASFASGDADAAQHLASYVRKVLSVLQQESNRVARLSAGDADVWNPVIQRLEQMAFMWFGPHGREEWAREQAQDVSSATCADLWEWLQSNEFPFDVAFDRWAARGLVNRLHGANRERRRHEERVPESLDRTGTGRPDGPPLGETLSDEKSEGWTERMAEDEAITEHLTSLLARLKPRDALVLQLWYLQGLPPDEIAAAVGETVPYTHVLRYRALSRLRRLSGLESARDP